MVLNLKQQLEGGLKIAREIPSFNPGNYSRIVFCGIGGSIMPAEAITMLWLDNINCYINHASYLPQWVRGSDYLVICVSWSGNTEETISAYENAKKCGADIAVVTSRGGRLAELAKRDNTPLALLPNHGLAPRNALPSMLSTLLTLLSHSDTIEASLNSSIFTEDSQRQEIVGEITESISGKTPLIYSSFPWRFLGDFWKKFLNENCKIHAFYNFMPEAGHNEIAGIKREDPQFFYLLLKDTEEEKDDFFRLNKLEKLLSNYNASYFVSEIKGDNRFEKIINQYILASLTSKALAEKLGINPDDISIIEDFKKLS